MVVEHRIVMTSSQGRLLKLLKGLQAEASRWPGYRLGSTWQELDQPATFVSMSHWSDAQRWTEFVADTHVQQVLGEIEDILARPGSVHLYVSPLGQGAA